MRILTGMMVLATVASAGAASAQSARLTDVEFIKASRCAGLVSAEGLGVGDAAPFEALLKFQRRGREPFILDRARNARTDATRAAARADEGAKARLIAERDGICQTFVS